MEMSDGHRKYKLLSGTDGPVRSGKLGVVGTACCKLHAARGLIQFGLTLMQVLGRNGEEHTAEKSCFSSRLFTVVGFTAG